MMSGFVRTEIKQFMDCFLPVPVTGQLTGDCWGAEHVLPRDQDNGLEDKVLEDPAITGKVNYTYWDGTILYDKDGCFGRTAWEGWDIMSMYSVSGKMTLQERTPLLQVIHVREIFLPRIIWMKGNGRTGVC